MRLGDGRARLVVHPGETEQGAEPATDHESFGDRLVTDRLEAGVHRDERVLELTEPQLRHAHLPRNLSGGGDRLPAAT